MQLLKVMFALTILLTLQAIAEASVTFVFSPRCKAENKKDCGAAKLDDGWKKVVTCTDDHEWHYVIEKNKKRMMCWGIHALAGAEEGACKAFEGDVQKFKECPMFKGRPFKVTEP